MTADLAAVPLKIRRKIGADTAFHNRIAHLTHAVPVVMVENNVHVATMGIEPASAYRAGPDNAIRTAAGALPAILHQYDRISRRSSRRSKRAGAEQSTTERPAFSGPQRML